MRRDDIDNLRHMLGADSRYKHSQWGFRNRFLAAPGPQIASMERLVALGLVDRGREHDDGCCYRATEAGARIVGVTPRKLADLFPVPKEHAE